MLKPDSAQIMELAQQYNTIPVYEEIYADVVTPIMLLRRMAQRSDRYYFLESVEGGLNRGRYSFLGFHPILRVTCRQEQVIVEEHGEKRLLEAKPFEALRQIMGRYHAPQLEELPPFCGGLVGYFAYHSIGLAEPVLKLQQDEFPDYDLMLFEKVIAYDHLKQKIVLIVNIHTDNLLENYGKAAAELAELKQMVYDTAPLPKVRTKSKPQFTCNVSEEAYTEMVERTKQHIFAGDIFQAVISRRFETAYEDSLLNAYRVLRTTNPSPYMVFMQCDDVQIISTSPETLVKLQNGKLSTYPVAGSRPRGKTRDEDLALEQELLQDEKELAEHNMLVDLGRNDIGRLAKFGTVKVSEYQQIHRYSRIMHICSEVNGIIADGLDAFDAIQSILPAGTLSGAPKIRACQLIDEIEAEPRGIYGGALGYIDFRGNMDTCIAIRMAVKKNNKVTVQAGGGIVADSVPHMEYLESENKAKAVIQAVMQASEVDD